MTKNSLVAGVCVLLTGAFAFPCTSILVTKGASADRSVNITYSCDGEFLPHLEQFPAADYPKGAKYQIKDFGGKVLGEIPQVEHTYKVVGLMNEFQLAIGETTFDGRPELTNPEGLFEYFELMKLALQRAKTAREAIQVIADLVEKHGYQSTGESFSIADKEEAWIMEMIGPGKGGKGAIWVAQRVPDGMVSAHANMARIGEFPLNDPDNCQYAKNVISFAEERGYYKRSEGPFHFSKVYNPPTEEQVRNSLRRVWSVFRRVAPSANLSADYSSFVKDAKPYPLWIKPDKPLSVADVFALHRDHFEGTPFDTTKDLSAGPFGAPDRVRPLKWKVDGKAYGWERPIATPQAAFVFVSQSRAHIPDSIGGVYWYGPDNPFTNFFIPLYTTITELPKAYTIGSMGAFSRESAWWTFNFVANYANLRFCDMIQDIQAVQKDIEALQFTVQPAIEQAALALRKTSPAAVPVFLTRYCLTNARMNLEKWWELSDLLIAKYNDGYRHQQKGWPKETGYPESWYREELQKHPEKFRLKSERDGKGEL